MLRALYTAATGMNAQEKNIDVISNNLANINTTGFKKSRADFQDLVYQYIVEPGAQTTANTANPTGIQIGLGVETVSVQKIFTQGDLTNTGRDLDIAIEGEGMLAITHPSGNGLAYTRAGSLRVDQDGQLITPEGFQLDGLAPIPTDALSISISQDGIISALVSGSTTPTQVGTMEAYRFPNKGGLRAIGMNLFEETEASGTPQSGTFGADGFGRVSQGFLESSNVSVVEQVVNMITAQRAYEASSKGVQSADDMLNQAINLKR